MQHVASACTLTTFSGAGNLRTVIAAATDHRTSSRLCIVLSLSTPLYVLDGRQCNGDTIELTVVGHSVLVEARTVSRSPSLERNLPPDQCCADAWDSRASMTSWVTLSYLTVRYVNRTIQTIAATHGRLTQSKAHTFTRKTPPQQRRPSSRSYSP